ncbi:MAG: hypothetical protein AAFQ19_11175 [Pseudomonadota bacterium]|uniref:Uncharacterized protein n=1 Tax=Tateyamaria omphalii TaxID=299262 RepID=A0A1P8N1M1_9RHOB|nr:hypothetical protein [Tateyamaria omphalii]APX14193.1 hypothetical protein BWR18_20245 [Tateyamaria omphalii]
MTKHDLNAVQRTLAASYATARATDALTEGSADVLAQSRQQVQLTQNLVAQCYAVLSDLKEGER